MLKFGAPETSIHSYPAWIVLLRPDQVTLGSLVLIAQEPVTAFSQISRTGFTELAEVTRDIEKVLSHLFDYDKLNYLMLMMVDPHVHFHVIPRYSTKRYYAGQEFFDRAWPGPPELGQINQTDDEIFSQLRDELKINWPIST